MVQNAATLQYKEVRTSSFDFITIAPLELEQELVVGVGVSDRHNKWDWKRAYGVGLYAITIVLLYSDQNLLAPNLSQVANEFGFSDDERDRKLGGDIALAFFLLGAPSSLIVGCWADQSDRMILMGWTIGIGEGACFATYFTQSYRQLYVCRAVTGLSLGGALPLMYSVLGDWFRAEERHVVSAIVGMGCGLGIALGQGIAGFVGPSLGWRTPFLIVSVPALICALLLVLTVQDPVRGGMEKAFLNREDLNDATTHKLTTQMQSQSIQEDLPNEGKESSVEERGMDAKVRSGESTGICDQDWRMHKDTLVQLLSTPTVILALLQGAPGCVPWGIINTFLNDYLSEDRGMTVEGATSTVLLFGFGNFLGLVLGGACGQKLYCIDPRYPPCFAGAMAILGCFPFWLMLNTISGESSVTRITLVSILAGAGSGATGPIVKASLQNVTLPRARGQAFALFNTFDDFGRGLGPVFVSLLISKLGGRTPAFNVGVCGWLLCGFFNLCMFFSVAQDELKIQATLSAEIGVTPSF